MMTLNTTILLLSCGLLTNFDEGDKKKIAATVEVNVTLKTDALARGTELQIGDVASIKTDSPEVTQRIIGLSLGLPPQPGYNRVISRNDIMLRVMREGVSPKQVKFIGGTQAFVQPSVHHLSPTELTRPAELLLDAAILAAEHSDVSYKLRANLTGMRVPIGRFSRELKARLHTGAIGYNHVQVDIDVVIDGKTYKTLPIYYALKRFYKVLSLTSGVHRGSELNETNLEFKRIEAPHGVDQYLTSFAQVRGKTTAARIRRGTILTDRHLVRPSLIRSGDIVELILSGGRIQIKTKVRAMDDGHLGKYIRVLRLSGLSRNRRQVSPNSILVAQVVSANAVAKDTRIR